MEIIAGLIGLGLIVTFWKFILRFLVSAFALTIVLGIIFALFNIDIDNNEVIENIVGWFVMIVSIIISIIIGMTTGEINYSTSLSSSSNIRTSSNSSNSTTSSTNNRTINNNSTISSSSNSSTTSPSNSSNSRTSFTNNRTTNNNSRSSANIIFNDIGTSKPVIRTGDASKYSKLSNAELQKLLKEISEGTIKDPFSQESFKAGETVYLCTKHHLAYHRDSWEAMEEKCQDCGNNQHTKVCIIPSDKNLSVTKNLQNKNKNQRKANKNLDKKNS